MSKSGFMPDIRLLPSSEWPLLREVRLFALSESPESFLSTLAREAVFDEDRWLAEFSRGTWHVSEADEGVIGLLGVTREPGMPRHECYLEYIWVHPDWRGSGFAVEMISSVLDDLRKSGVRTAYLWILDGNDTAVNLYKKLDFVTTSLRQLIEDSPGRSEEKWRKDLG
jgi:ribosomal protein S18 acetylase RimI-like enzyme